MNTGTPISLDKFDSALINYRSSAINADMLLMHLAATAVYECCNQKQHGAQEALKLLAYVYAFDKKKATALFKFFTNDHVKLNKEGGVGLPFTKPRGAEDKIIEIPGGEKVKLPAAYVIKWSEERRKKVSFDDMGLYCYCVGVELSAFKSKAVDKNAEQTQLDFDKKVEAEYKRLEKLKAMQKEKGYVWPDSIPEIISAKEQVTTIPTSMTDLAAQIEKLACQDTISEEDKALIQTLLTLIHNHAKQQVAPSENKQAA